MGQSRNCRTRHFDVGLDLKVSGHVLNMLIDRPGHVRVLRKLTRNSTRHKRNLAKQPSENTLFNQPINRNKHNSYEETIRSLATTQSARTYVHIKIGYPCVQSRYCCKNISQELQALKSQKKKKDKPRKAKEPYAQHSIVVETFNFSKII